MNRTSIRCSIVTAAIIVIVAAGVSAQTPNAWGYTTVYGNVYGTFGLASTMQSMYNVARSQMLKKSSTAGRSTTRPVPQSSATPSRTARRNGVFRPDPSVDTGKAFADALGETPDQKALIREIYATTKSEHERQTAAKGWTTNIAGALTFFSVAALTVYHGIDEPSNEAVSTYYNIVDASLDEIPELASVSSKDKQNYNNMLIGFGGLLLAGQTEAKQTGDKATADNYKKLAGMLITMVLKTEPDNLLLEDGRIVLK